MTVVIDTNVVVSAALRDRDPEKVIEWIVAQPDWQWVVTDDILDEYLSVLGRPKFALPAELHQKWAALIANVTTKVDVPTPMQAFDRDPADARFIAGAIASEAEYLITGDRDLITAAKLAKTTILSVSMFKRRVCDTA